MLWYEAYGLEYQFSNFFLQIENLKYKIRTGLTGIEPAAAWLKAKRSARLSYRPIRHIYYLAFEAPWPGFEPESRARQAHMIAPTPPGQEY